MRLVSLLLVFCALLGGGVVCGQGVAPAIQWQNTVGGTGAEYPYSVFQTTDGGYLLAGQSGSGIGGDKTEASQGGQDYWVVKLDVTGAIQWEKTIGGSSDDYLRSVIQTTDGGYLLGGISLSGIGGDKTEASQGHIDYWLVKLDSTGQTIEWQNTIGGSSFDHLYTVIQVNDGGYLLGGYSNSGIGGDKTEDTEGNLDYWVVKLDAAGVIQWQNTIGGDNYEYLYSVIQTADGGYLLGGSSNSDIGGDKTEDSQGGNDFWMVKLDATGAIQWQNTIGGGSFDWLNSAILTADGGYLLGGYSESGIGGDKTEASQGEFDYWVVKLDTTGAIQWQNTIGGTGSEYLFSVIQTANGGYLLGGYSYSGIGGDKTEASQGLFDYWVVKLAPGGNTISGSVYLDTDANGVRNAGEPDLQVALVNYQYGTQSFYKSAAGSYTVYVDSGNCTVQAQQNTYPYYFQTSLLAQYVFNFQGYGNVEDSVDFGFAPIANINDLEIDITPIGPHQPGFNICYTVTYQNVGTTVLLPDLELDFDNTLTFANSSIPLTPLGNNQFTYQDTSIGLFETRSFNVCFTVPVTAQLGDIVYYSGTVNPVANDTTPSNNTVNEYDIVVGSFDPNDKRVTPGIEIAPGVFATDTSTHTLTYTIRFQNTGTAPASFVAIKDTLDASVLNPATFRMVSASHPYTWAMSGPGIVTWTFNPISLPDSGSNEPASHGFVKFTIDRRAALGIGDSIVNRAAIYFDFNAPIITEPCLTVLDVVSGSNEAPAPGRLTFRAYPNPASGQLNVSADGTGPFLYTLMDATGRSIRTDTSPHTQFVLNVESLPAGVYLLHVSNAAGLGGVQRVVVQ